MEQRSLDAYYDPNFQCEELQGLISKGIQMADKLKMWYTRKHAQYDYTVQVSDCVYFFRLIDILVWLEISMVGDGIIYITSLYSKVCSSPYCCFVVVLDLTKCPSFL